MRDLPGFGIFSLMLPGDDELVEIPHILRILIIVFAGFLPIKCQK